MRVLMTSLIIIDGCIAEPTETYIQEIQAIEQKTDLQIAENTLLESQLKSFEIRKKLNVKSSDNPPQQSPKVTPELSGSPEKNKDVSRHNNHGLQQIYGLNNDLTAIINYGNMLIPVKQGEKIDEDWEVGAVNQSHIILLNRHSQEKKYLYLTTKNK